MPTDYDRQVEDDFDRSVLGRWSEPVRTVVDQEAIAAYAAATNDTVPAHATGEVAPIVFAVVPSFTLLADTAMGPVPPHLMMRILHGEHDIQQVRPLRPGDRLTMRSRVVGIHGKSSGVVVTTQTDTRDADEQPVNTQYFAGFFKGGHWPHEEGAPFPAHALPEGLTQRPSDLQAVQHIGQDQTFRYAEASGDPMPIHTDEEFARAMGLPGIIAHGLCSMAFTSVALTERVCADSPERLHRLAVRFAAVARPGQDLTTDFWRTDAGCGDTTYAFQTSNGERLIITDGLAQITDH